MRADHAGLNRSTGTLSAQIISSQSSRMLASLSALFLAVAVPSQSLAQTASLSQSLGQPGQYAVFEVSNGTIAGQSINVSGSAIYGNVALGQNTLYTVSSTTVNGSVYVDSAGLNPKSSSSGTTITGNGGNAISTSLASAGSTATNDATTLAGLNSGKSNNSFGQNGSAYSITANAGSGINVVDVSKSFSLTNGTITLNGSSNSQFVFNISQGISLNNVQIILKGVAADNVIFNVTGGSVNLVNTIFNGTILDMTGQGSVMLNGVTDEGAVITNSNLSISGSVVSIAPELPTIMMAGLACFAAVAGKAGFRRLRRRIPTGDPALPQT